jgi:hypothetical protein
VLPITNFRCLSFAAPCLSGGWERQDSALVETPSACIRAALSPGTINFVPFAFALASLFVDSSTRMQGLLLAHDVAGLHFCLHRHPPAFAPISLSFQSLCASMWTLPIEKLWKSRYGPTPEQMLTVTSATVEPRKLNSYADVSTRLWDVDHVLLWQTSDRPQST